VARAVVTGLNRGGRSGVGKGRSGTTSGAAAGVFGRVTRIDAQEQYDIKKETTDPRKILPPKK